MNGVIAIDKPEDITSARVVAWVKRITGAKKVGHAGTLDPFATGVMVCCLNDATRLSRFFLQGDKRYQGTLYLGVETDTLDGTGSIVNRATVDFTDPDKFSAGKIKSAFNRFQGAIDQSPPVFSALKHHGVPLYKLARSGVPVQKPPRRVTISSIKILEVNLPAVRFEVSCSAGTYIRSLCSDIGKELGCGGHLKELRRIESSKFTIEETVSLEGLETLAAETRLSDKIISMTNALREMPEHLAEDELIEKIMNGKPLTVADRIKVPENKQSTLNVYVKIVDPHKNLLAILQVDPAKKAFGYCCVFRRQKLP